MKNRHSLDQATAAERQARAQWQALLARLQSGAPPDPRLQQVRQAISRGEFLVDALASAERLLARMLTS